MTYGPDGPNLGYVNRRVADPFLRLYVIALRNGAPFKRYAREVTTEVETGAKEPTDAREMESPAFGSSYKIRFSELRGIRLLISEPPAQAGSGQLVFSRDRHFISSICLQNPTRRRSASHLRPSCEIDLPGEQRCRAEFLRRRSL